MNILYLTSSPVIGGAELSLLSHLKYIDKKKFHVTLVCSSLMAGLASQIEGIEVIEMKFYLLHRLEFSTLINYHKMIRQVRNIVIEKDIDILHTNSVKAHYIGSFAIILTKAKLIWWMRDETINRFLYNIFKFTPTRIVFISHTLESLFPKSEKNIVIFNGTDVYKKIINENEKLNLKKEFNINNQKVILCVERLVKWKGVQVLIDSLTKLDYANYICLVIGSGKDQRDDNEEELQQMVKKYKLESKVKFLGWRNDIYKFYQIADLFVHPVISLEPFGLVVIEAMSFGVCSISSNLGGPTEIINNDVNGILIDANNSIVLEQKINNLLNDDNLRNRLGTNGREEILSSFTQEIETKKIEDIYLSIL